MLKFRYLLFAALVMLGGYLVGGIVSAEGVLLTDGGFDSGFGGWQTYTTDNGDIGTPLISSFDTNGDGSVSPSAEFSVGQAEFNNHTRAGGGIYQMVNLAEGDYTFKADIASYFGQPEEVILDTDAGLFELLVDGVRVAYVDLDRLKPNGLKRSLLASVPVAGGSHKVAIQITRLGTPQGALHQYIDNVSVSAAALVGNSSNGSTDGKNCNYQKGKDKSTTGIQENCNSGAGGSKSNNSK